MKYDPESPDADRLKIVRIREDEILGLFNAAQADYDCITLPRLDALPDGYLVLAVHYSFSWQCFAFKVWHPDFDHAPSGQELPTLVSGVFMERSAYAKDRQKAAVPA